MRRVLVAIFATLVAAFPVASAEASAPVCADVALTVGEGSSWSAGVECSGSPESYAVTQQPIHGVGYADNGLGPFGLLPGVQYAAEPDFSGTDSFMFTATNGEGTSAPATVSVTVVPQPDGALASLPDPADCAATPPADENWTSFGCTSNLRGTRGTKAIAASPDGKHLYTAGSVPSNGGVPDSVAHNIGVLTRAADGSLSQPSGESACITVEPGQGCLVEPDLGDPVDVIVSPDGKHVYVATRNGSQDAVLIYARDAATGALTRAGCVNDSVSCTFARAIDGINALAVSPDGATLYAGSDAGVAVFARNATSGALSQATAPSGCTSDDGSGGCGDARAIPQARDLAVSPEGSHLYVASGSGQSVAVFTRGAGGVLSQPAGPAGCMKQGGGDGCASARGITGDATSVLVTPDGRTVYVGSQEGSSFNPGGLAVLPRVQATGALSQLEGTRGCVNDDGADGCRSGYGYEVVSMAVDPGSNTVYVEGVHLDFGTPSYVFHVLRREADGGLSDLTAPHGCVSNASNDFCSPFSANVRPEELVVTPDGRNLYAAGGHALLAFERNGTPSCAAASATVAAGGSVTVPLSCTDPNGDPVALRAEAQPANGVVEIDQAQSRATYTPAAGWSGADSFSYRGSDGSDGGAATVSVNVMAPPPGEDAPPPPPSSGDAPPAGTQPPPGTEQPPPGTEQPPATQQPPASTSVTGTSGADRLDGGSGADRLFGGAGADVLLGGDGADSLFGGADPDRLEGGAGDDRLDGGNGDDTVRGGDGDDRLRGGSGGDLLDGGAGRDYIETGGDALDAKSRAARSAGSRSTRDTVRGGNGADRIDARDGDGDDRVSCGAGRDTVVADAGDKVDRSCERIRYERRTPKRNKKKRRRR